jgi:hypothetical protein
MLLTDLAVKELEILTEVLPQVKRIGVLWNPTTPSHTPAMRAVEDAAKAGVSSCCSPSQLLKISNLHSQPCCAKAIAAFWSWPRRLVRHIALPWPGSHCNTGCQECSGTRIT